jgi:hypothetical protein
MRKLLIVLAVAVAPSPLWAQPGPDTAASPPAGSAAGTQSAAPMMPPEPVKPQPPAAHSPTELRQICADAMNANPTFAEEIAKTVNEETVRQHLQAGKAIAKNEKHVILAYAAMWLVAAGFVLFLWRRQQALKVEIAQLRRDLETAAK